MIGEALWQACADILPALAGMCLAGIGLVIEISENRRPERMARNVKASEESDERYGAAQGQHRGD